MPVKLIMDHLTPSLSLKLENSVSPCVSLTLFKQLSQHWSSDEWVHQQVSPWASPLRVTSGTPTALSVTQPQSPLVLTARSGGDFSSLHRNPRLGSLMWDLEPLLLSGEPPQLRYHSWLLATTCGCGTSLLHVSDLPPSTSLHVASSVYQLWNFCSYRFQEILSDGCSAA